MKLLAEETLVHLQLMRIWAARVRALLLLLISVFLLLLPCAANDCWSEADDHGTPSSASHSADKHNHFVSGLLKPKATASYKPG